MEAIATGSQKPVGPRPSLLGQFGVRESGLRISRSLGPALGAGVGLCFYMVSGRKGNRSNQRTCHITAFDSAFFRLEAIAIRLEAIASRE